MMLLFQLSVGKHPTCLLNIQSFFEQFQPQLSDLNQGRSEPPPPPPFWGKPAKTNFQSSFNIK